MKRLFISTLLLFGFFALIFATFPSTPSPVSLIRKTKSYDLRYELPVYTTFSLFCSATTHHVFPQALTDAGPQPVFHQSDQYRFTVLTSNPESGMDLELEFQASLHTADLVRGFRALDRSCLHGRCLRFHLTPKGQITLLDDLNDFPRAPCFWGNQTDSITILTMLQTLFPPLPEHPVQSGQSWTLSEDDYQSWTGGPAHIRSRTHWTVSELSAVDGNTHMVLEAEYAPLFVNPREGSSMFSADSGNGKTRLVFPCEQGMIQEASRLFNLNGDIRLESGMQLNRSTRRQSRIWVVFHSPEEIRPPV
jgi:hypothetical protein